MFDYHYSATNTYSRARMLGEFIILGSVIVAAMIIIVGLCL